MKLIKVLIFQIISLIFCMEQTEIEKAIEIQTQQSNDLPEPDTEKKSLGEDLSSLSLAEEEQPTAEANVVTSVSPSAPSEKLEQKNPADVPLPEITVDEKMALKEGSAIESSEKTEQFLEKEIDLSRVLSLDSSPVRRKLDFAGESLPDATLDEKIVQENNTKESSSEDEKPSEKEISTTSASLTHSEPGAEQTDNLTPKDTENKKPDSEGESTDEVNPPSSQSCVSKSSMAESSEETAVDQKSDESSSDAEKPTDKKESYDADSKSSETINITKTLGKNQSTETRKCMFSLN